MEPDILENYRKAGQILSGVMQEAKNRVEIGVPLLEVAEFVEHLIRSKGAQPAFPCNISLDRAAAHYTPSRDDKSMFGENMVKLDVGVHVNGYIADAAVTIDLSGQHKELAYAAEDALASAIKIISPGISTGQIGAVIENKILEHGFKPVYNLTGHGLSRYEAHAEPAIPNRFQERGIVLKEGDVIAIEPFATNGSGRISESQINEIYGISSPRAVRLPQARDLLKVIIDRYKTLPFARRWLEGNRVDFALLQLVRSGAVHRYPVLWEIEGAIVSQSEHTVIVQKNGCEVITML